jgi:hypothetical protein
MHKWDRVAGGAREGPLLRGVRLPGVSLPQALRHPDEIV